MTVETRAEGFSDPPSKKELPLLEDPAEAKTRKCCTPNIKMFLVALSFTYFCKTLSGSYMKSSITQIERRFEIPSSVIGVIDGSFEMGNLLVLPLVSYFGAKFHRPKIIGAGCMLMSIGTLLTALPHFLMGRYNYESTISASTNSSTVSFPCSQDPGQLTELEAQQQSSRIAACEHDGGSLMWVAVLLGNMLRGVGEATIPPLGISFIDDFASPENSAFYIGCLHTIAVIGPLFGFTLGAFCARLYVDIGFVDLGSITISMKDSRWVGAWWLGFIIAGGTSLVSAFPFFFLPKTLPKEGGPEKDSTAAAEQNLLQGNQQTNATDEQPKIIDVAKGFFPALKRLLTNKIYVFYLIANIIMFNAFIILITYTPKYLEQQFGESTSKANFLIGVTSMPAVSLGIFFSGIIMKKFKLDLLGAAKVALGTAILGCLCTFPLFALTCDNAEIAGLTVSYGGTGISDLESSVSVACNSGCGCPVNQWEPVCGENGMTYVSPCFAGCNISRGSGKNTTFHDCRCIEAFPESGSGNFSAVLGQCPREEKCSRMFIYYLAFQSLSFFVFSLGSTPLYIINLRCVEPDLKSLSVGIFTMALRVLGGIPAPIYFGALIDSTCIKWGTKKCGGRGACRMYDNISFRLLFLGLILGLRLMGYVFFGFVIVQVKKKFTRDHRKASAEGEVFLKQEMKNNVLPEQKPAGLSEKEVESSA
ncbi:solute carrier organic anion transporter family member 1C1-like isoform X1 [Acipenser ruthenus]|uniref:solute carrier organic anion transporter family member 1C1-like isoform X1 n=2 Tax=Acipenser ruthenus TaxID=7906 RepID=UPI0015609288|nr:solute carrier organic anion transporter family member 1C1-like isoform X1 [Acipenser ruthenus]XP_033880537.2 solute carrier organic anion transporter family member 1C1-like isoform X1 [Acipenser ruthenus]XP_058883699.1 solute carrier organic anion transporter family member 1C1-like isoform X1 [Acipenser ruthenus]XP_058883700.1 solute carrier organic anion transporter family member 1C1-like isoform X1 [Acipenser ruthenus]XP_058883701.1 solute carrier organic anion transporter family member 1